MKSSNHQVVSAGSWVVGLVVATLLGVATASYGSHTVLSGGDSSDGWVAPSSVVFAYNFGSTATNETIQGLTFQAWTNPAIPQIAGGVTVAASNISGEHDYGAVFVVGASNDKEMERMEDEVFYSAGTGTVTLTITGLSPNGSYRADAFQFSNDATRSGTVFKYNGVTTDSYSMTLNDEWLVQDTVTADSGGQLVLQVNDTAGGTAVLSGLALSEISTPEPSSIALLGVGGLVLARRRGRAARV